jgi:hypothetical protein
MNAEIHEAGSASSPGNSWVDRCAGLAPSNRRNFLSFSRWQLLWIVSLAMVAIMREFGLEFAWATREGVAVGLAAIPFVLAGLTLWAYARFVRSADELTQKIQAEALKMAVALVVLYLSVHPLAERLGAGPTEFPTPLLFILMGHALGQTLAARRYR